MSVAVVTMASIANGSKSGIKLDRLATFYNLEHISLMAYTILLSASLSSSSNALVEAVCSDSTLNRCAVCVSSLEFLY